MGDLTAAEYDALPPILTAEQVALILDTTPARVTRWAVTGKIPGTQIGRAWRFSKARLEAHLR